jgi:hypothetical protein
MACLLVFLAGFRRLIRQARPDDEWISTLVFGAGLVVITLEQAGDALEGGAALDTSVRVDPSVVRGLMEGSFVFYGAIGLIMSAALLASAGYATLATGALPRWTGWAAYVAAVINLVAAPSIFEGTDYTGFYTASGYVTSIGQGAMVLWFLIASISMLVVKREAKTMTAATAAQHTAFATAAEVFIAGNNITYASGILAPVGILIVSLVMLKGVFREALRIWAS